MRRQLTLFVDEKEAVPIERIRNTFNPEQSKLIRSHITLCREDELTQLEAVLGTLEAFTHEYISIQFGAAERFADGKGVLLPARVTDEFDALRKAVLKRVADRPRTHEPHITLLHPSNASCTDAIFEQIKKLPLPTRLSFKEICLIEQQQDQPWTTVRVFSLTPP